MSSDEPGVIESQPGGPNANIPEGVAHTEPDLMPGEEANTNAKAPIHPVGTGLDVLLEEDGTAGKDVCIEGGIPRVELHESGFSHLTTPEEAEFLTSPPPHITPKAASMQRSPAVNIMTPEILQPDRRADLEPPPHDTPPPTTFEAVGRSAHQPPTQGHRPSQVQRAAQTWCRRPHGRC